MKIAEWKNGQVVETEISEREFCDHLQAEKSRPLTTEEVSRILIAAQINTLAVDDTTALRMISFYPEWQSGVDYPVGHKVQYGNRLWRCIQGHNSIVGWEPINAASLWEQINESHTGELTDPIPYGGNMALTAGLYYVQSGVLYRCTRDTEAPVYHRLQELVGIYVEEV